MKTQADWKQQAKNLLEGSSSLTFGLAYHLCSRGRINGAAVDALTRNLLYDVLGMKSYGISAPEWSCAYRSAISGEEPGMSFLYWSLGHYQVGIFPVEHSDKRREAGFDRIFHIPTIPVHDDPLFPSHLKTPEERKAWRDSEEYTLTKKRKDFIDLLALHHFAEFLQDMDSR
jgi:hypothetical protein